MVTVPVPFAVHVPLLPVTVYTVVPVGLSACVPPVKLPGTHVYVVAPVATKVAVLPGQILAEVTATVGAATTVNVFENGEDVPLLFEQIKVMVLVPGVA